MNLLRLANNVLFGLVVAVVLVFALANIDTLLQPTTVVLPFLGEYSMTAQLLGLLAISGLSWLFWLINNLQDTQNRAEAASYLKKIEDLRVSLDKNESERFKQLETRLNTRLDRLRDELAADIAHADQRPDQRPDLPLASTEGKPGDPRPSLRGLFGLGKK
jgi:hypothetical protein